MKIILFGDSTIANYEIDQYPCNGWGQVFPRFFKKEVEVLNFGKNGRSTKSFYDEGWFNKGLDHLSLNDYIIIQFGHDDQKLDPERRTEPFTTYMDYLKLYLFEIRKKGGVPLLLSPVYRRHFDQSGNIIDLVHGHYPDAMRRVAEEENVDFLDISALTKAKLQELGNESSKYLYMNFKAGVFPNYPNGLNDDTHLSYQGALWVSKIVVDELKAKCLLLDYLS